MQEDIQADIMDALHILTSESEPISPIESFSTFEEAGVMTRNKGLVIRLTNGREYQVSIVRSH